MKLHFSKKSKISHPGIPPKEESRFIKALKENSKIFGLFFLAAGFLWVLTWYIKLLAYSGEDGIYALAAQIIGFMWLAWYLGKDSRNT